MEDRLNELESKIDSIDGKLNQVIEALVGNPLVGNNGLSSKIERMERELEEIKDFKKKIIYAVSAIVSLGLVMQFFVKIYFDATK